MPNINKIKLSGTSYDIQDANATKTVELTQAQYDALVTGGTVDSNTFYVITDGEMFNPSGKVDTSAFTEFSGAVETELSGKTDESAFTAHTGDSTIHVTAQDKTNWNAKSDFSGSYNDLTDKPTIPTVPTSNTAFTNDAGYITEDAISGKADYSAVTEEISAAVSGKVDTSTFNTYSGSVETALSGKQDTLSAGTNITIVDNVISAEGGGGKAISAGTNISVTTGETADTINCKIPYSDVIYTKSDIILGKDMPSVSDYNRVFYGKKIASRANDSFNSSIGIGVPPSNNSSDYNELYGSQSIGIGGFKIGNGSQYSNFVSGCVAIGYGAKTRINNAVAIGKDTEASGTTKTNINNQLTIDTSNQVYIYNKDNTEMICLQDQLGGSYVTTDTEQIISGRKIFTYSANSGKAIEFKQTSDSAKVGFRIINSAATNNEVASFELRPNTFTIDNVQHPLMYFGHYRNTNTANAGVPQTVIGFRQYDQLNAAAYHYLMPLPEKAKTPFNLTTSFKDYYAPMGFKNGSTMITADNTGVVDLSSELDGLKLKKLTQAEYDALATKDNSTLYVIVN